MASIRKSRNKWIVNYYVGRTRKRNRFNNKAEAESFKRELLLRPIDLAIGFIAPRTSLKEAAQKYLELVTVKKSPGTHQQEAYYFNELVVHFGEHKELSSVTLMDLQGFQLALGKKNGPSTVNRKFNTIRHFFNQCVAWQFIRESPCRFLANLKEEIKPIKIWSDTQIQTTIEAMPRWVKAPMEFIALTGVRRGEAVKLTWDCVDFENRVVFIRSAKGGSISIRSIPLTERITEVLHALPKKGACVFVDTGGTPINLSSFSRAVTRVTGSVGLKGMGLHGLRHSILTKLAVRNVSLEKIRALAGHSNLRTTQKYLHLSNDELRSDLEAVGHNRAQKENAPVS